MPNRSPTLPCATSRPQDPPCCGRQVSSPASQRTSHPTGQRQSPQADPPPVSSAWSSVAAVGLPRRWGAGLVWSRRWPGLFPAGSTHAAAGRLTIHAWQRREHRLRRDQGHPRGRSPKGRTHLRPNGLRTTWPANHAVDPVGQGLLSGSASDTSNDEPYRCDQPCVARSAGTQS
jgi:hypothetical protein